MTRKAAIPHKRAKQFAQRVIRLAERLFFVCLVAFVVSPLLAGAGETKTLLFFGDSLTAGLGLEDPSVQAFPALIQKKITAAGLPWRVVNAGLSGETSAGGLRRVDWILRQRVEVFVLELGGNDGLRGLAPETTRANLQAIIDRVREKSPTWARTSRAPSPPSFPSSRRRTT
jgi:lysophospholipase L1-like esterase